MPSHPRTTLWLWPTGLFPRRILYFLRIKNITTSILSSHNITIIPVTMTPTYALESLPGFESRPGNTTLPVMRVGETWIYESLAIMEYLEELLGKDGGAAWDIRGDSALKKAHTRDVLSLLGDAVVWSGVAFIHSEASSTSWSGLTASQMSASAAAHADKKFRVLMARLEYGVSQRQGKRLSGGEQVTLADICLVSQVEYMTKYGMQWLDGWDMLGKWYEGIKGEEWVLGKEVLEGVEGSGRWEDALG